MDITRTMVLLHPSCDDYEGLQMDIDEDLSYQACKDNVRGKSFQEKMAFGLMNYDPVNTAVFEKQVFVAKRMLPPGEIRYYMSIDGEKIVDEGQVQVEGPNLIETIKARKEPKT